jgi:glycosyltransferase involved in cell wall biosynthesis
LRRVSVGSSDPLRILFIAPFPPRLDATHGGGRAAAELLVQLAGRHRVALQYLRGGDEPSVDVEVRQACDEVREIARPPERGPFHSFRLTAGLLRGMPMWAAGWRVASFGAALRDFAGTWKPDVAHFEYHIMGQYLRTLPPGTVLRILRQAEPGTAAADDRAVARRGLGRAVSGLDRRAWATFETRIMHEAEAVVALTDRDAAALRSLAPRARIECIPLGCTVPSQPLDSVGAQPPRLVFIGNFAHPPNVDAATRLAREIMPRILRARPDAVLYLVGPDVAGRVTRLAGAGIVVAGQVPDVRPYLDAAAVVIAPLRLGGGMRVKVLEALAGGKAMVVSPLAIEGLALSDGEQVVLAETDDEFATRTTALLADADRRASLARHARAWVTAHCGWERVIAAYEALYTSLLAV